MSEYCCFNSQLAYQINVQVRKQLGKGWQSCNGFTIEEFMKIDLGAMDLSAVTEELMGHMSPRVKDA